MFANKYVALSVKFIALSARPLVLRGKLRFCEYRSVKCKYLEFKTPCNFLSGII